MVGRSRERGQPPRLCAPPLALIEICFQDMEERLRGVSEHRESGGIAPKILIPDRGRPRGQDRRHGIGHQATALRECRPYPAHEQVAGRKLSGAVDGRDSHIRMHANSLL